MALAAQAVDLEAARLPEPDLADAEAPVDLELVQTAGGPDDFDDEVRSGFSLVGAITSRHLTERDALSRVAQLAAVARPSHPAAGHRLFCDPCGYGPRRGAVQDSLEIGSAPDRGQAVAAADELSAALRIRLVVVTRERFVDNH